LPYGARRLAQNGPVVSSFAKVAVSPVPKRRLPPLNALRAFESAARHQSMSRAAEELGVTHGAISRHVSKLEDFLCAKLFAHSQQHVTLTKRGAAYAARLQSLFDQIDDTTATHFREEGSQAKLRIGVLSTFAMRLLIPKLARFKDIHPEIAIEVSTSHEPIDPSGGEIDVAIWLGGGNWPELASEFLFDEELIPVGSSGLLGDRTIQSPADLEPFLLLHAEQRADDWQRWLTVMGWTGINGHKGLRLEYSALVYQGALDGLGLAMAQTLFVQRDIAQKRLLPVVHKSLMTGRSYYAVCTELNARHPSIKFFIHWLKTEIAQIPDVLPAKDVMQSALKRLA
jgi:LysR family glycine cleavage system transcriptional activator